MFYIDVILPLAVKNTYTYLIDEQQYTKIKPGIRVAVEFGSKKIYSALVYKLHQVKPKNYNPKPIHHILDDFPLVTAIQLKHWEWIAEYYMCTLGEVYKAAIPSSLLLQSETIVLKNSNFNADEELNSDEFLIIEALEYNKQLPIDVISTLIDRKNVLPVLSKLIAKNAISLREEINEVYKPKLEKYLQLHPKWQQEAKLEEVFSLVQRANKQYEVLLKFFSLQAETKKNLKFKQLTLYANCSSSLINTMVDKEIFEVYYLQVDRVNFADDTVKTKELSDIQSVALSEIKKFFNNKDVVLLKGVTGSGKTELYVKLIDEQLKLGKQVLYLLPEIALTTQIILRLKKYFGNSIAVYHSKYSLNERVEVWNNVLNNSERARLIIGVRSSVLLPFQQLGLIIVDEEHEPSYKQHEPAPRYHARDAAIILASYYKANVLLGTATPSVESYYNVQQKKYQLVTLDNRYGAVLMPNIKLIDLKEAYRKKKMKGHFSNQLINAIQNVLENKEQVILFQNRRGFSPVIACKICGVTPQCVQCDVSLTYHKLSDELKCHYCDYTQKQTSTCVACGSSEIAYLGLGTEQVENEIQELFPKASVARMDFDTTKGKYSYEKLLEQFQNHEIDILVGTQMLSKGLDFSNVSLVGVLNADNLLNFPDYRAHERSFQLLAQVAGRSGRTKQGNVLIQTYAINHPIIHQVLLNDYEAMCEEQIKERQLFKYPPFYKIIEITLKHKNKITLEQGAIWFGTALKNAFGANVLGPSSPIIAKIRNKYIKVILLKIPTDQSLKKTKIAVNQLQTAFQSIPNYRSIQLILDVDPY